MRITTEQTVGEIAASFPGIVGIFEAQKIDYCCGGNQTLESACKAKMLDADSLIRTIEKAIAEEKATGKDPSSERDWTRAPLTELIGHIKAAYHARCRAESARLMPLFGAVTARHGGEHPELEVAQRIFSALTEGMIDHMQREEAILFPYIEQIERMNGAPHTQPDQPVSSEATVREMMENHNEAGTLLRKLRTTMVEYAEPADACNSYRALLKGLSDFEHDLHVHVHLENNVLFPRTCDLGRMENCRPN